jgi:hypothetical protein
MPVTVTDLIYGALAEIRVARGGDVVRAEDQALCLLFLNEVIDRLAVTPNALYVRTTATCVLVPGLPYYVLGPVGPLVVPRRPVRILSVVIADGATQWPLTEQSRDWYTSLTIPPTHLLGVPESFIYVAPWPNGTVALYPAPSAPDTLIVTIDSEIAAVTDTDTIDLPQGYSELLRLWTAKKAAPSFAREFSASSQQALTECLADVFGTNIGRVNNADTRDAGVPGGGGGTYDYRTGQVS